MSKNQKGNRGQAQKANKSQNGPRQTNEGNGSGYPKGWDKNIEYIGTNVWNKAKLSSPELFSEFGPKTTVKGTPVAHVRIKKIDDPNHPAFGQCGLFSTKKLTARSHVVDYLGLVTSDEYASQSSDYTLSLTPGLTCDAEKCGNESRFVNDYRGTGQSRANVEFKNKRCEKTGELRMALYVMFNDIPKNTELLVSYGKGFWSERLNASES